ncbi:MAG: FtsX-like permease family protein, partial [Lysobacteraceae bacterium]
MSLTRWLLLGEWRAHPVRALLAIAAIAVGVAMGFAIHLINAAAFNEFSAAVKSLSGQADVQVAGREPLVDESVYARLAAHPQVAVAAPVLELSAAIAGVQGSLRIVGIDALRAGFISPDLTGVPLDGRMLDVLADDAIFLSPAAQAWLGKRSGDTIVLRAGLEDVLLRVAGPVARARAGQRIAVMDIGAMQWRFQQLGRISRVDLKLRDGVDRAAFRRTLAQELEAAYPGRFAVRQPDDGDQEQRNANLSRAYRVNLTVLALVALFTGAFLVFSTQALSVMRRRSQFALLRVLGLERGQLLRQVLLEGASLGVLGALLGVAGGYGLAAAALHFFGGDLGAGYFPGIRPQVAFTPLAAGVFFLLGLGVALLGCLAPAIEAARARPAVAIKSGADEAVLSRLARVWPSLACLALAALLAFAPPVFELPLFGYLAIALLLVGGIGLMPRLAAEAFRHAERALLRSPRRAPPILSLALARLANAPGQASIALGGVLASFSLMVAMGIMVASFRVSVDDWMGHILPADLY